MSQITKRALAQSLKNLLLRKPLSKITIRDITQDCGINRMTFYYHFKDIYDLVEWVFVEDAKVALSEKNTHDTWQQGLLQIFEVVRENRPFLMNVYNCVHQEQLENFIKPLVDRLVMEIIGQEIGEMSVSEADQAFIARVYSYIMVGITLDWIKDDLREDPKQIVDRLAVLLRGTIHTALSRFQILSDTHI